MKKNRNSSKLSMLDYYHKNICIQCFIKSLYTQLFLNFKREFLKTLYLITIWRFAYCFGSSNFDGIVIGWSSSKMVSGSCALPPRWPPQCSCVVIETSFDPGERLQAPGSLWYTNSSLILKGNFLKLYI
jgi:hypothetical protein